jgi:hypothetical protein
MDTDIRMLLKAERENWKKRMVKETKGAYIVIYLGFIFSVFISTMYGFKYDYSSDDKKVMIMLTIFIFVVYHGATAYVSYVRENGRSVNIFEKYRYIPVDISVLRRVKLILTARIVAPFVITGQMAAIFIRVIDPDNQGGSLIDISVFMPLIIGCLFILEKFIEYRVLSRKAELQ